MATISNLTIASRTNGFTASGTLDGIQFNSIGVSDGQGLTTKWNRNDGPWKTSGSTTLNEFAVNAVDIDWNGATLGSSTIHTTGELLSWIKTSLSGKQASIGSTAIGTATNPVYWDGSKLVKTTYTLGKSVPSNAVFTDTVKTLPELVGTSAIGSATKPVYWNGSSFVAANNYPSGVSTLTLTKTGTSTIDLLANTTYTLTVGDKTLAFKTPADNTGSAADGNTWRPVYVGSTSILTNSISSGNLKFDGGEQINPVWDSTNKVIKFNHYRTDGRSYGANQVPGFYKFASDAWGHIIAGTAVTKADITALGIPAQDTVYTHPTYTAKSSGLYKVTVNSTGHVSATAAVTKSDITALGIPAQDTVYTHPTFTAKSSGLYKITVDANGHVTGTAAVTASDLKSVIKDLLVAGDNITITENSAGKLVVSCTGVQAETIALKVIGTLKENGAEVAMSATTATVQSVLATDTNTYVNSNWTIDNTTNFSINATSNVSAVTVTANVSAAKGTVSGSIDSSSQTTSYGKRVLKASFTQVPTTKSTKVTATHDGSSSYVTLKYTKAGQAAGTYNWSGTLPAGLAFSATTGTSIEVKNTTSSEITVAKDVVQVTNTNGTTYKFGSFTVPGIPSTDVFYFGTTKPTSSNYQSLTPKYTSSSQVYNKEVNVTGGSNIYYLCPNSKALTTEQRKAAMLDQGGNVVKFSTEIDTTSISGYTIYVQSIVNSGILKFNVNY